MKSGYMDSLLEEWGDWMSQHEDDTGYPPDTIIWKLIRWLTAPRGDLGHRILCADMPWWMPDNQALRIYKVNGTIKRLEEPHRGILHIRYAHTLRLDGTPWTNRQRALALAMKPREFTVALSAARRAFARLWNERLKGLDKGESKA